MQNGNEILVSCIIPIYNVPEEYMKRCIESVINQTLKDIEIILIDDGSEEKCKKLCDDYEKRDNRIKVIHQKNKGLAGARNSGLDIANGEYVTYIDGDDYIEKDGLEKLFEYSKDRKYDVIRGQFFRDYGTKIEKTHTENVEINKTYEKSEEIFYLKKQVLNFNANISSACGALYNRKLLIENKIYNDEKLKQGSEDVEFSFKLYDCVKTAIIVDVYFYHYVYNEDSISTYSSEENNYRVLKCFSKILENMKKQDAKYYEQLYFQFNIRMLYIIVTTFISGYFNPKNTEKMSVKRKQISNYLKQDIVKNALKHKYIKRLDIKRKIILLCIRNKMFLTIKLLGKIRYKQKN